MVVISLAVPSISKHAVSLWVRRFWQCSMLLIMLLCL